MAGSSIFLPNDDQFFDQLRRTRQQEDQQAEPSSSAWPGARAFAAQYNVDPRLIDRVEQVESSGNPLAVGPPNWTGELARGSMQILPSTFRDTMGASADFSDPRQQAEAGVKYFSQMLNKYQDPNLAYTAYVWGPGRVDRLLRRQGVVDAAPKIKFDRILGALPEDVRTAVNRFQHSTSPGLEPEVSPAAASPAAASPAAARTEDPYPFEAFYFPSNEEFFAELTRPGRFGPEPQPPGFFSGAGLAAPPPPPPPTDIPLLNMLNTKVIPEELPPGFVGPPEPPVVSRGLLSDIGAGLARTPTEVAKLAANVGKVGSSLAETIFPLPPGTLTFLMTGGRFREPEPPETPQEAAQVEKEKKKFQNLQDYFEKVFREIEAFEAKYPGLYTPSEEEKKSILRRALVRGPQSAATSIAVGLPAFIMGGLPALAFGGGSLFSISEWAQADRDIQEYNRTAPPEKQIPDDIAFQIKAIRALAEGGGEVISNFVGGKILGLDNFFKGVGKDAIEKVLTPSLSKALKQMGGVALSETIPEMGTAGTQAYANRLGGIPGPSPLEAMKEAGPQALVASLIFFGVGFGGRQAVLRNTYEALANPHTPVNRRLEAAASLSEAIRRETNDQLADDFLSAAREAVIKGEPLPLDLSASAIVDQSLRAAPQVDLFPILLGQGGKGLSTPNAISMAAPQAGPAAPPAPAAPEVDLFPILLGQGGTGLSTPNAISMAAPQAGPAAPPAPAAPQVDLFPILPGQGGTGLSTPDAISMAAPQAGPAAPPAPAAPQVDLFPILTGQGGTGLSTPDAISMAAPQTGRPQQTQTAPVPFPAAPEVDLFPILLGRGTMPAGEHTSLPRSAGPEGAPGGFPPSPRGAPPPATLGATPPSPYPSTPEPVIQLMLNEADLRPNQRVLEPSAGTGEIAHAIRKFRPVNLEVGELDDNLRKQLGDKGFTVVSGDFLSYKSPEGYDRIIMSPPFDGRQDGLHILHAYAQLKPGGRVVSTVSQETFRDPEFQRWFAATKGKAIPLPARQLYPTWDVGPEFDAYLVTIDAPASSSQTTSPQRGPKAQRKIKEPLPSEEEQWAVIGKSPNGRILYENQYGMRSYLENDVRHVEPVDIVMEKDEPRVSPRDRTGTEWELAAPPPSPAPATPPAPPPAPPAPQAAPPTPATPPAPQAAPPTPPAPPATPPAPETARPAPPPGATVITPEDIHLLADARGIPWDNDQDFLTWAESLTGEPHLDRMTQEQLRTLATAIYRGGRPPQRRPPATTPPAPQATPPAPPPAPPAPQAAPPTPATPPAPPAPETARPAVQPGGQADNRAITAVRGIANWVKNKVIKNESFSNQELHNKAAEEFGGTIGQGAYSLKDATDAMELGVNLFILESDFEPTGDRQLAEKRIAELREIIRRLPTQTARSSGQDEFQQFSTPPHQAFLVAWLANIKPDDIVLEPSAGVGGLAVFAKKAGAAVVVNEFSMGRTSFDRDRKVPRGVMIREMQFDRVFNENAEQLNNVLPPDVRPTVILMNPPFSATASRIPDRRSTAEATKHIEQALLRLAPGGRLVAIVGEGMAAEKSTFRDWWDTLGKTYNIRANVNVPGSEYAKYGTRFGNQIVVIDKTGPTPRRGTITESLFSLEDVTELLADVRSDRWERNKTINAAPPAPQAGPPTPATPPAPETAPPAPQAAPPAPETARPAPQAGPPTPATPPAPETAPPAPQAAPPAPQAAPPASPTPPAPETARPAPQAAPPASPAPPAPQAGPPASPTPPAPETARPAPETARPAPQAAPPAPPTPPAPETARPAPETARPAPETARPAPQAAPPASSQQPQANTLEEELARLTEEEFNALINEVVTRQTETRPPEEQPEGKSIETILREAADHGIRGLDESLRALHDLFGGKVGMSIGGLPFDSDSYAKAKPHFRKALWEFQAAGRSLKEFFHFMGRTFSDRVIPHLKQFYADIVNEWQRPKITPPPPSVDEELSNSLYEPYRPSKFFMEGMKPYPGDLVESAAMNAVSLPDITYVPHIPREVLESGALADAQLEAIAYCGQAHEYMLDEVNSLGQNKRQGAMIGDGTGTGKSHVAVGLYLDNFYRGRRKALWVSKNFDLLNVGKKAFQALGLNPDLLFEIGGKIAMDTPLKATDGMGFITYDTLASSKVNKDTKTKIASRLDQVVEWFGTDYDGLIVFDESHLGGNAVVEDDNSVFGNRNRPSLRALAMLELQERLPNARIVYMSATAATEVANLAYASRLGLWGRGTAFGSVQHFISAIKAGGIAAMEVVTRDLKAMGRYLARSLDYSDVRYETLVRQLSDEQKERYNRMVDAWQIVFQNLERALRLTAQDRGGRRAQKMSAFWSSLQRFFNQVLTGMTLTGDEGLLSAIEKDLSNGFAVVIQLTSTNEQPQERAVKALAENETLEDLNFSPVQILMDYLHRAFPTTQYHEIRDESSGTTRWVEARDSQGRPIENAEAVRLREQLLDDLGAMIGDMEGNPLDVIIERFGAEHVAEVTGRNRRFIRKRLPDGSLGAREEQKVYPIKDIEAFLNDKKKILIFSEKGGTGQSYHADKRIKNTRQRVHYLLQPGWRADVAVQGLGRTHRANQVSAPIYKLVTTDLKGHRRFVSSIARRLDQLGALTRGERKAGSQGLFSASDNLESPYAELALTRLWQDLHRGNIPGFSIETIERETGLRLRTQDGSLSANLPRMVRFLNLLLALRVERQNVLFDEFSRRLDAVIAEAIADGTFDVGLETIRAKRAQILSEEVVYVEPRSKAETSFLEIELTHDRELIAFEKVNRRANRIGYYRHPESGRISAVFPTGTYITTSGSLEPRYESVGVIASHFIKKAELDELEKLDDRQAEELWNQAYAAAPKERTRRIHLISGALLPIWDRLEGNPRVVRLKTTEGRRLIGRLIADDDLQTVMGNLRIGKKTESLTPDEIIARVIDDEHILRLANGWQLRSRRVRGEQRLELGSKDFVWNNNHLVQFRNRGIYIVERVSLNTAPRVFIPLNDQGKKLLKELVNQYPIVQSLPPVRSAADVLEQAELKRIRDTTMASQWAPSRQATPSSAPTTPSSAPTTPSSAPAIPASQVKRGAEEILKAVQARRAAQGQPVFAPSPEEMALIEDFIRRIGRHMFDDVGLRFQSRPDPASPEDPEFSMGATNFTEKVVDIFDKAIEEKRFTRTLVHELWHLLSRYLPPSSLAKVNAEYHKQLKAYLADHPWVSEFLHADQWTLTERDARLVARFYPHVTDIHYTRDKTGHVVSARLLPTEDNYRFASVDEFFAEAMTLRFFDLRRIEDEEARSWFRWMRRLARLIHDGAKRVVGLDPLGSVFQSYLDGKFVDPQRDSQLMDDDVAHGVLTRPRPFHAIGQWARRTMGHRAIELGVMLTRERGQQVVDEERWTYARIGAQEADVIERMSELLTHPKSWKTLQFIFGRRQAAEISRFFRSFERIGQRLGVSASRQGLLFDAAESIKTFRGDLPVFGTRIFERDPDTHTVILDDLGEPVVKGWRFTPDEGQKLWDQLTDLEKNAVRYWVKVRELLKAAYNVSGSIEGYMPHRWEDGFFAALGAIVGQRTRLKKRHAKSRIARGPEEAQGYIKDFERAIAYTWTELIKEKEWNNMVERLIPLVSDPIGPEGVQKGWMEVPKTALTRRGQYISQLAGGRQMPIPLYKEMIAYMEPVKEATTLANGLRTIGSYIAMNLMLFPGTIVSNAVGSGLQYASLVVDSGVKALITGQLRPFAETLLAPILSVLRPTIREVSPEVLGSRSNIISQFESHSMMEAAFDALLTPVIGAVDNYVKRSVMVATARAMGVPIKKKDLLEHKEAYAQMRQQVDTFGLDYLNINSRLAAFRKHHFSRWVSPFVTFGYKMMQLHGHYFAALNPSAQLDIDPRFKFDESLLVRKTGLTPHHLERISRLIVLGSVYSLLAMLFPEDEEHVGPHVSGMSPALDRTAMLKVGEREGRELYWRPGAHPWFPVFLTTRALKNLMVKGQAPTEELLNAIGVYTPTAGPFLQGVMAVRDFFKAPDIFSLGPSVARAFKPFVPFGRIMEGLKRQKGGPEVASRTFLQEFAEALPFPVPDEWIGARKIVIDPHTKRPIMRDPSLEQLRFWTGVFLAEISPKAYRGVRRDLLDNIWERLDEADTPDQYERALARLKVLDYDAWSRIQDRADQRRILLTQRELRLIERLKEQQHAARSPALPPPIHGEFTVPPPPLEPSRATGRAAE